MLRCASIYHKSPKSSPEIERKSPDIDGVTFYLRIGRCWVRILTGAAQSLRFISLTRGFVGFYSSEVAHLIITGHSGRPGGVHPRYATPAKCSWPQEASRALPGTSHNHRTALSLDP